MKSYNSNMHEEITGAHTIEITLQQKEYVGHITQTIVGDCAGLEALNFNFECEDECSQNDCNLRYDEDMDCFYATLKDPDGNTLDVEGDVDDFNRMIVKLEIIDYKKD